MYGLIALFDETTEQLIIEIWNKLKERSISNYAFEVEDRRPHITLASYNDLNLPEFIEQMNSHYFKQSVLEVEFKTMGTFMNSGALFIAPTQTNALMGLHSKHHDVFSRFNDEPNSLYAPDRWIPHCTLANRLSHDALIEAFAYCVQHLNTIKGDIVEVALIDVSEKDKAPILHAVELKRK